MSITLNVPTIQCQGCADTITKEIKAHDANANVKVDIEGKKVDVTTDMSESSVKQAITVAGHKVA